MVTRGRDEFIVDLALVLGRRRCVASANGVCELHAQCMRHCRCHDTSPAASASLLQMASWVTFSMRQRNRRGALSLRQCDTRELYQSHPWDRGTGLADHSRLTLDTDVEIYSEIHNRPGSEPPTKTPSVCSCSISIKETICRYIAKPN